MFVQYLTNLNVKFYFSFRRYDNGEVLWFIDDKAIIKRDLTEHPRCVNRYFVQSRYMDTWF